MTNIPANKNFKQTKFDILEQEIMGKMEFFINTTFELLTDDAKKHIDEIKNEMLRCKNTEELKEVKARYHDETVFATHQNFKITATYMKFPCICPQFEIQLFGKEHRLVIYLDLRLEENEENIFISRSTISDAFIYNNSDNTILRFFTEDEWLSKGMTGGTTFAEKIKFVINMLLWGLLSKGESKCDGFLNHLLRLIETEEIVM